VKKETEVLVSWRDWILTLPFVLSFLGVLIAFEFIQRFALLVGRRKHEQSVVALNRWLTKTLKILGTKITYQNHAKLIQGVPIIAVSNHQSLFDIPILHTILASHYPRFIAKKELSRWIPSISFNLRRGENAVIDRSNPRQAIEEIENLGQLMVERNFATVIFPEGTRARTGELKKFRVAGVATLLQMVPHAIVVPITIDESWKLAAHKGLPVPRNVHLRVIVGGALDKGDSHSLKDLIAQLEEIISNTLKAMRQNPMLGTERELD